MNSPAPNQRYTLKLTFYDSQKAMQDAAFIIYQSTSPTLVASLNALPYTVGRTFSYEELNDLHQKLKAIGVGHRFESQDGVSQIITFHPGDEKREEEITQIRKKKRVERKLIWAALAGIILIGLSGAVWFFIPSTQNDTSLSKASVARVMEIKAKVQRRSPGEAEWKDLKMGDFLFAKDSVRTFESAQASISYQEGGHCSRELDDCHRAAPFSSGA